MVAIEWQGQQGSNLRPAVLETAALPTELYPYPSDDPNRSPANVALPLRPLFALGKSAGRDFSFPPHFSAAGSCPSKINPDRDLFSGANKKHAKTENHPNKFTK